MSPNHAARNFLAVVALTGQAPKGVRVETRVQALRHCELDQGGESWSLTEDGRAIAEKSRMYKAGAHLFELGFEVNKSRFGAIGRPRRANTVYFVRPSDGATALATSDGCAIITGQGVVARYRNG